MIRGPWMKDNGGSWNCDLNFYYHMMGDQLGSLNVYIEKADGSGMTVRLKLCHSHAFL